MPRSPARDLSDRYIGKRGYFRNPDWIRRWKRNLAWMAFLGACIWAAVDIMQPSSIAAYAHTHGPLASPHAAFDENCAACHVSQKPDFNPLAVFSARDRWHDLSCGKCHAGPFDEGFAHHSSANDAAKAYHQRCSNCHHDHLGRLNSLVRLKDADCNNCHSDLAKWHIADKSLTKAKGEQPYQNKITSFAADHPEFRSLDIAHKPRTLTFSHAVHLNPGQAYTPDGKEALTVEKLRKLNGAAGDAVIARYAPGAANDAKVQLDCASCHQLDPGTGTPDFDRMKTALDKFGEPTRTLLPPRPEGAYFLPMNYEASCRACHPLSAPAGASDVVGKQVVIPGFDVPHRRQPADMVSELKAGYLKGMLTAGHPALAARPEPGGKIDAPSPAALALGAEADRLAQVAERQLFSPDVGCAKCHAINPGRGQGTQRIEPVPDRTVWLSHAKFNHAAHRGTVCATCHPGVVAASIQPVDANKPEPVQIEGVASCKACHSPPGTKVTLPDGSKINGGGVRASCTDCHRYHHGDLPVQGRGAMTRYPKDPRTLADWLKGK